VLALLLSRQCRNFIGCRDGDLFIIHHFDQLWNTVLNDTLGAIGCSDAT
jgi:hypothetical protein